MILKNYSNIWNKGTKISLIAKFGAQIKNP